MEFGAILVSMALGSCCNCGCATIAFYALHLVLLSNYVIIQRSIRIIKLIKQRFVYFQLGSRFIIYWVGMQNNGKKLVPSL